MQIIINCLQITKLIQKYPDFEIGYSGHELLLGTTVDSVLLVENIIEMHY